MTEALGHAGIAAQLEKILADPLFATSQRLAGFLRFTVEAVLAGQAGELKEYTIGVEVFGRGSAYSPQEEPVVRIMAGRLRAKLAEYYLGPGAADPLVIELPRGGYVPRFLPRAQARSAGHREPFLSQPNRLVGRVHERSKLETAFGSLSEGGRVVAVSGEAGMGKTSLV